MSSSLDESSSITAVNVGARVPIAISWPSVGVVMATLGALLMTVTAWSWQAVIRRAEVASRAGRIRVDIVSSGVRKTGERQPR